jgi:hypothetical protein
VHLDGPPQVHFGAVRHVPADLPEYGAVCGLPMVVAIKWQSSALRAVRMRANP